MVKLPTCFRKQNKKDTRSNIERKRKKKVLGQKIERKQKKKRVPDQTSEESKRKRKILNQRSEENKRNIHKGLRTKQYLNSTKLSQAKKKEKKPRFEVVLSLWLPTKILCIGDFSRPRTKQKNRKGKRPKHSESNSPPKTLFSRKSPIDPWSYM